MAKETHSLNAQVGNENYWTFYAIVKKGERSSINSYMDEVVQQFNEQWKKENPAKAKQLKQWIEDVKAEKKNSAS